jgi:hypothetical protein
MADGAEQIAKPENCVVPVAQGVKNANVVKLLVVGVKTKRFSGYSLSTSLKKANSSPVENPRG